MKTRDFEPVMDYMSVFIKEAGVTSVRLTESIPDWVNEKKRKRLMQSKEFSFLNESTHELSIYFPFINEMTMNKDWWALNFLSPVLSFQGLKNLVPYSLPFRDKLLRNINSSVDREDRMASLEDMELKLIDNLTGLFGEQNQRFVSGVFDGICKTFGLHYEEDLMFNVFSNSFLRYGNRFFPIMKHGNIISLGMASEAFKRMDYPMRPVILDHYSVQAALRKLGVDLSDSEKVRKLLDRIRDSVMDPLAVVNNSRIVFNEDIRQYLFLLGINIDGQQLMFATATPSATVNKCIDFDKQGKGEGAIYGSVFPMSMVSFLKKMTIDGMLVYLKSGKGLDENSFELMRYVDENIKSGAGLSPVMTSGSLAQLLNSVTKVVNNFKNPISSEKYLQLFKEQRDPIMKKMEEDAYLSAHLSAVTKVDTRQPAPDRMQTLIPRGLVPEADYNRLHEANINTIWDIAYKGFVALRSNVNSDRSARKIVEWIGSKGVFFSAGWKPTRKLTEESVKADFTERLIRCNENTKRIADLPRRLDGTFFEGSAVMHLCAASLTGAGDRSPVWVTRDELHSYGCEPGKAEAVPVKTAYGVEEVFNLSKTSFPKQYPDEYRKFNEQAKGESRQEAVSVMTLYINNLLRSSCSIQSSLADSVIRMSESCIPERMKQNSLTAGVSLAESVGESSMKEMRRNGRMMTMMEFLEDANKVVKSRRERSREAFRERRERRIDNVRKQNEERAASIRRRH